MNPLTWIPSLFKTTMSYFSERAVVKAAVNERKDELKKLALETKLEGIKNASEADMKMDVNSRGIAGWMDDVSFAIFLSPLVLAFIPTMVTHVVAGFKALESFPLWYQYALGMMLVAVWGFRRLVTPIVEILVKKSVLGK